MYNKDNSVRDEINILKSVTTEQEAERILNERIELIASDPEHSDIPKFMRMDAAKFTVQSVAEAFIDGEDKERIYKLFKLDRAASDAAMKAGVQSALAVMANKVKDNKTSSSKPFDEDGIIVKIFAPLVTMQTQQEADDFLENFKKQYHEHPVLAAAIAGKDITEAARFSIQAAVELFIRSDDQKKLLYQLFNLDIKNKAQAIDRGKLAVAIISSRK